MSVSEYELVLMLDPEQPDERRDEIAANARTRIESNANLKADTAWGMRKLAYEIRQRTEADYRFFRFETESPLLDDLNHTLKITDGVLRFRIFKVDPESPVIEPPPPVSLQSAPSRGPRDRDRRGPRGGDYDSPADSPAPAAAEAAPAEAAPAEPAAEPAPAEPAAEPAPAEPPAAEPAATEPAAAEAPAEATSDAQ